jgi:hypothetical protein
MYAMYHPRVIVWIPLFTVTSYCLGLRNQENRAPPSLRPSHRLFSAPLPLPQAETYQIPRTTRSGRASERTETAEGHDSSASGCSSQYAVPGHRVNLDHNSQIRPGWSLFCLETSGHLEHLERPPNLKQGGFLLTHPGMCVHHV